MIVAGVIIAGAVFQQDMAGETKLGGIGGGLAAVVGLRGALGHHHIGALLDRLGHQEFQFAGLVAAWGHAGAIIGGSEDTAAAKMAIMKECGIHVVDSPAYIGKTVAEVLGKVTA